MQNAKCNYIKRHHNVLVINMNLKVDCQISTRTNISLCDLEQDT